MSPDRRERASAHRTLTSIAGSRLGSDSSDAPGHAPSATSSLSLLLGDGHIGSSLPLPDENYFTMARHLGQHASSHSVFKASGLAGSDEHLRTLRDRIIKLSKVPLVKTVTAIQTVRSLNSLSSLLLEHLNLCLNNIVFRIVYRRVCLGRRAFALEAKATPRCMLNDRNSPPHISIDQCLSRLSNWWWWRSNRVQRKAPWLCRCCSRISSTASKQLGW